MSAMVMRKSMMHPFPTFDYLRPQTGNPHRLLSPSAMEMSPPSGWSC